MKWSTAAVALVFLTATASLACYPISSLADRGPAEWDGRIDIPANWVFIATRVPTDTGSWWYRRDGEERWTRLNAEIDERSELRVWPDEDFDVGGSYEVISSGNIYGQEIRSRDVIGDIVLQGSFSVSDRIDSRPSPPLLIRTRSEPAFRQRTRAECDEGASAFTILSYLLVHRPENALYVLRDRETGAVLWETTKSPESNSALLVNETVAEGVLELEIEIFDFAGQSSSINVVGDAGGAGGCASTSTRLPFGLLALLLLLPFVSSLRRSRERSVRSLTRG